MHNDPADCNIHTRKLALSAHLMPRCQSYEFHEFHHFKLLQAVCHKLFAILQVASTIVYVHTSDFVLQISLQLCKLEYGELTV